MEKQKKLIENAEWRNLIVLDACRFDYLENFLGAYLDGELSKVVSPGHRTQDWIRKVFGGKLWEDVVYVSANPYINGRGIDRGQNFDGSGHFYKVVDVWDFGWDKNLKTVPPVEVNKAVEVSKSLHPKKRLIIHYMQPHPPYLELSKEKNSNQEGNSQGGFGLGSITRLVPNIVPHTIRKYLGDEVMWSFSNEILGDVPGGLGNPYAWHKYGKEKLRKFYRNNLETVLKYVSRLVDNLEGKTVVTSDHSELLGENGRYGHSTAHKKCNLLHEVPWLEIQK